MNQVIEAIMTRRSVRAFTEEKIPRTDLELIAKAGIYAPSGMNRQTWKITVVSSQEMIGRLADVVSKELGREGYDFYKPAALMIPSNLKDSQWGRDDNACALENIFLAAHSMGIGSVWINQLKDICDRPAVRSLLTEMGIPKDHVVYGLAALGYSAQEKKEPVKTGEIQIIE